MTAEQIMSVAEAMRKRRADLIAQPLDRIWRELSLTALATVDELGFSIVRRGLKCPFDNGQPDPGLSPEEPCPICGDLGTFEATDKPSRCIG